ncbi:MAG: ComEC/Rec2 family competence protein, partial [Bauldia sp.]|nr:ComEC/Rec2 family competence protein [Bauldia sp.]
MVDREQNDATRVEEEEPSVRSGRWSAPGGGHLRLAGAAVGDLGVVLAATFEREMEAGRGFLWLPVAFAAGILVYFALPQEPWLPGVAAVALVLVLAAWRRPGGATAVRVLMVLAAVAAGLLAAKVRTDSALAPVMPREMTVTVSGWIAKTEEAARGGKLAKIQVARIEGLPAAGTPVNVRVTIRSGADALAVGDGITVLASLSPPGGPVMPGGYDFALVPFYERIGGVGFAFGAAKPADIGPAPFSIRLRQPLEHLRDAIRLRIEAALPGDYGHIAAALVMGDQRGIAESTQQAMRASGLGHILSISGLHMALVAGSVFWLIRALLALSPGLALRYPIKKWAAACALIVATFYLGISGAEVATVRSYVMLAIMLVAIMLDRRALTLRNVALAALVILVVSPESLLSISFQMSFAATIALIAVYEALSARADRRLALADAKDGVWFGRAWAAVATLFMTSLVAGLATAPFGAFYFQRVAPLTIVANMAVAPAVGLVVMPMALLSVVLMPFGLEALPLTAMQWGLMWMVTVAKATAAWSEGWGGVRALPPLSLLLVVAGLLWLALWRERWRLAG